MKKGKKILSMLLSAAMVCTFFPQAAFGVQEEEEMTAASHDISTSSLTISKDGSYTVTGTTTTNRIVVEKNVTATVTLNNVNITGVSYNNDNDEAATSPIDLAAGATLTLVLSDNSNNALTGGPGGVGDGAPGIHVPEETTLIIQGNGSLTVNGGTSTSGCGGIGIGGKAGETEASGRGPGENCGTVVILEKSVTVNGNSYRENDIGGGYGGTQNGDDGQGIRPVSGKDNTYEVWGELTLPCDITIPEGATVVIPEGASLTVPGGKTLTNNGTLLVQGGSFTNNGTVTGNQPAYTSEVTVEFSKDGQTLANHSAVYGSTITVTATMKKADSAANMLRADAGTVDFYLGTVEDGTKLNQTGVSVTQGSDGTYTAALSVTLEGENWKPSGSPYTITADFGGYVPGEKQGGDSLATNTGSAQLTVTKAQQTAPTGSFLTINHTDSSIMLNFSDSSQSVNENGIEIAYAAGTTATEPTSNWTTAERIESSKVYVATIENLSPGTPYILFARYKGDDFHKPSPAVASSSVYYTDPKITTESLPNAYVDVKYSVKLKAQVADGVAVRWSITGGSLPDGLTLSSGGTITGTPTAATSQAVSITVCATFGEGADTMENTKTLAIAVTKSDAELGTLTVSGNTGIPEGTFQYGDTITVTFTPRRRVSATANALTPDTATLTYTPDGGDPKQLATASAQADGSFTLTYDTKQKTLPIMPDIPLTVSYGGSGALNPVTETVTVALQKGMLRNQPLISGSFVYGGTLTINYTKQDDETVSYQWFRSDSTSYTEIDGATSAAYTLTEADIGKHIYVQITSADEWHTGQLQSAPQVVTKAPQTTGGGSGITYYDITAEQPEHGTITLERDCIYRYGDVDVTLTPEEGYEVKDLLINGVSVGAVSNYTIKDVTEDIHVTAVFGETEAAKKARIIKGVRETDIELTYKMNEIGRGFIKIHWTKEKGYAVNYYEVFRSAKNKSNFSKEAYFTKNTAKLSSWYKNTKEIKKGTRYYYKVRGVREIDGKTYYTKWSNTTWRTGR